MPESTPFFKQVVRQIVESKTTVDERIRKNTEAFARYIEKSLPLHIADLDVIPDQLNYSYTPIDVDLASSLLGFSVGLIGGTPNNPEYGVLIKPAIDAAQALIANPPEHPKKSK